MRKLYYSVFGLMILVFLSMTFVSANDDLSPSVEVKVYYFYSTGCPHCSNVIASGILEDVALIEGVVVEKLNLHESQENRDLFDYFCDELGISRKGWPFVVVKYGGEYGSLLGDGPIIDNLESYVVDRDWVGVEPGDISPDQDKQITWWSVIVAALIDSVNPCAFGVLIFLMASLLKMGSSRRALRAGLIYSFIVFLVYFLMGWGLYRLIDTFSSSPYFYYFYLGVAGLIFLLGLLQLKDVFWYGKGVTLRISSKAKPIIEKFMASGTLISIIILGVIVSLFELPCTGEIYIGILTIMSLHKTFGIMYLLIYNLIFILPLVVLTYLVYRGTSTSRLQNWTVSNRKYMKLISGLLLVGLATYIFIRAIGFV